MMEWCQLLYQKYLSRALIRLAGSITPNQVTAFNLFFTLIFGVLCFAQGKYWWNVAGLGILIINGILDYLDGDLAKSKKMGSALGAWLDSGCDMLIQSSIMAAVAFGLCMTAPSAVLTAAVMVFFIANNAMQVISLRYNNIFGFDSHIGNALFRKYMDEKPSAFNWLMKNMVDPTASHSGFFIFTFRYWLVIGILFDMMWWNFMVITAILVFRVIVMYLIYAMHLAEYKKLWILQALAIIDEERQEYYAVRHV